MKSSVSKLHVGLQPCRKWSRGEQEDGHECENVLITHFTQFIIVEGLKKTSDVNLFVGVAMTTMRPSNGISL